MVKDYCCLVTGVAGAFRSEHDSRKRRWVNLGGQQNDGFPSAIVLFYRKRRMASAGPCIALIVLQNTLYIRHGITSIAVSTQGLDFNLRKWTAQSCSYDGKSFLFMVVFDCFCHSPTFVSLRRHLSPGSTWSASNVSTLAAGTCINDFSLETWHVFFQRKSDNSAPIECQQHLSHHVDLRQAACYEYE